MIHSEGSSPLFWVEEINCTNYRVNGTPTKALKNITPEEGWIITKPYVSHV